MPKISREVPLAEITLRKYERPINLSKREIAKKVCLSLGLLMPGDFRDSIVDILMVIAQEQKPITAQEIEKKVLTQRKAAKKDTAGTASSNIRRQLKRLKDIYLIECVQNEYRLTENLSCEEIWDEKIRPIILDATEKRMREYLRAFDTESKPHRSQE